MLMMKACPRCSGDLIRTRDPYEGDAMFSCVQCGYASYGPIAVRTSAEAESKPVASRASRVASAARKSEYDDQPVQEEAGAAA